MIASLSGFDVDAELALILVLCGLGLWLVLSALFASGTKARSTAKETTSAKDANDGESLHADSLNEDSLDGTAIAQDNDR